MSEEFDKFMDSLEKEEEELKKQQAARLVSVFTQICRIEIERGLSPMVIIASLMETLCAAIAVNLPPDAQGVANTQEYLKERIEALWAQMKKEGHEWGA